MRELLGVIVTITLEDNMVNQNIDKTHTTPKDFFLHLLSIITLYISAVSFTVLLFTDINLLFPETAHDTLNLAEINSVRWHIATLLITFPVYIYTLIALRKEWQLSPEKSQIKIRKWLFYLTLFLAAVIIMGTLGSLIYYFLGGEITKRFLSKVCIALIVTGFIFFYYLRDLRQKWSSQQLKILTVIISLIVLIVLSYGFYLIGSPLKARKVNFDQRRMTDLGMIQNNIIQYWIHKNKLPDSLNELTNEITGFKVPNDPESGSTYGYRVISKLSFELCANFDLPSNQQISGQTNFDERSYWNWQHKIGYFCFTRKIDPSLYKNFKSR
jgi:competence protein ComGC